MIEFVVMWQWGVRFAVHPQAYLLHVPHPAAKTREATQRLGQDAKVGLVPRTLHCFSIPVASCDQAC